MGRHIGVSSAKAARRVQEVISQPRPTTIFPETPVSRGTAGIVFQHPEVILRVLQGPAIPRMAVMTPWA